MTYLHQHYDLVESLWFFDRWSQRTFGPDFHVEGIIDHIREELDEIAAEPHDVEEWIDVVILAFHGALRSGHSPTQVAAALEAKHKKNRARTWPDWRAADPKKAIKHIKVDES
jgi:uncharacterized Ntn-hydrolase superfamily protein